MAIVEGSNVAPHTASHSQRTDDFLKDETIAAVPAFRIMFLLFLWAFPQMDHGTLPLSPCQDITTVCSSSSLMYLLMYHLHVLDGKPKKFDTNTKFE